MTRSRDTADTQDNLGGAVAPYVAGKNKIINGDFGIWQRGTSFSANGYTADRWAMYYGGSGASAVATQQAFTPTAAPVAGYENPYFYQVVTTAGSDAGSYITFEQPIEDVRTFSGQTITISFWAKATSGTPKVGLELIQQSVGSGGNVFISAGSAQTISTAWTRYSFTVAVPAITFSNAQMAAPNTSKFTINFWLSNGSSLASRSGNPGLQSNTFQFWGIQAEAGSVATPFTTASGSIGGELALCQRYYHRFNGSGATDALINSGLGFTTTVAMFVFHLGTTMRTAPATIEVSNQGVYNVTTATAYSGGTWALNQGFDNSVRVIYTHGSPVLTLGSSVISSSTNSSNYFAFSAEL